MPGERPSTGIGARLREARERRGTTLREIADSTKISVRALDALERNDISRLPGGIFSRAFLRSFALEVGLDPEEMVRDFMEQFPDDSVTAGHPAIEYRDDAAVDNDRREASTFKLLIALSAPIAATLLYVAGSGEGPTPPEQAATAASAAEGSAAVARAPSTPGASPSAIAGAEESSDTLVVDLVAIERCSISTVIDGEGPIEREFQPGERLRLNVRAELVLTIANAGALAVTLNGRRTRPLGGAGKVATVRIGPANFRSYLLEP